ncbi:uncharacterized protein LY79DRAFT_543909 [Colletotrichum navitas]|uniref:Uncharacterized protein n=1 Tax=Colletotrichum navitas TaxID=681940 RepID=A0AAD8Q694_9PEZI|nr:uncharacterized protein LY79DRAFT_543909 [Colletotrichum navitas]KAK1596686.1 hypothetical protein LY79DRAFT_543909 [Colletotrichum navitas]
MRGTNKVIVCVYVWFPRVSLQVMGVGRGPRHRRDVQTCARQSRGVERRSMMGCFFVQTGAVCHSQYREGGMLSLVAKKGSDSVRTLRVCGCVMKLAEVSRSCRLGRQGR